VLSVSRDVAPRKERKETSNTTEPSRGKTISNTNCASDVLVQLSLEVLMIIATVIAALFVIVCFGCFVR
jgi:hypothetical protein